MTAFAWGLAIGYVIAKIIDAIGEIRSAKREAKRKIAEARERRGLDMDTDEIAEDPVVTQPTCGVCGRPVSGDFFDDPPTVRNVKP